MIYKDFYSKVYNSQGVKKIYICLWLYYSMVIKSYENTFSAWAFLIGVVLAILIGVSTSSLLPIDAIAQHSSQIYGVLVILGLLVGFSIKVSGKDATTFLLAGAVLVIVSDIGKASAEGSLIGMGIILAISSIFTALSVLFVPATIVVALKTVFGIARI